MLNLVSNVSVNSIWVHSPGQPPEISSKNLPGCRDLTFESCPGAWNSTMTGSLWKMKVKLQKNSVDQIFTGENKKEAEFLNFSRFTCFLSGIVLVCGSIFWFYYHTYLTKNLRSCPWLVYSCFHWVIVIHTYFCTKGYDYV